MLFVDKAVEKFQRLIGNRGFDKEVEWKIESWKRQDSSMQVVIVLTARGRKDGRLRRLRTRAEVEEVEQEPEHV